MASALQRFGVRTFALPDLFYETSGAGIVVHRPISRGLAKRLVATASMRACPQTTKEVVDASAGSFGAELARAARREGRSCTIYVPTDTCMDVRRLHANMAEIVRVKGSLQHARESALIHAAATGAYMPDQVGAYNVHRCAYAESALALRRIPVSVAAVLAVTGTGALLRSHTEEVWTESPNAQPLALDLTSRATLHRPHEQLPFMSGTEFITAPTADIRQLQALLYALGLRIGAVSTLAVAAALEHRRRYPPNSVLAIIASD